MYTVSITSQGQISLPAKVRRELGLHKNGKAILSVHEGTILLTPVKDLLELKGSLKTHKKPLSNEELHDFFAEGITKEVMLKSK